MLVSVGIRLRICVWLRIQYEVRDVLAIGGGHWSCSYAIVRDGRQWGMGPWGSGNRHSGPGPGMA